MFDRPSDTWYIYMRPFRVALLLQTRNLQHSTYLKEEKDEKDEKDEKNKQESKIKEVQIEQSTL
jgi:hypothetical protein